MSIGSGLARWVAMLRREMGAIAVVVGLIAALGLVLWRGGVFSEDHPDVPSCPELADTLPAAAGGTWAVSKPDPNYPRLTKASTLCELGFISADQRYSGTVSVFIAGNTDDEALQRGVRDARCNGSVRPLDTASSGYLALKTCVDMIGESIFADVLAAKKPRRVHMVGKVARRSGTDAEASGFARSLARTVADQGLTIPPSE
jgi:hypothetical protein